MAAALRDKQRRALAALLMWRWRADVTHQRPLRFVDEAVEPSIDVLVNDLGAAGCVTARRMPHAAAAEVRDHKPDGGYPMHVPSDQVPVAASPPADPTRGGTKCGAKNKRGPGHCTNKAGFKTDHVGQGRCYLHGGRSPVKHGRYSTIQRDDLRAAIAEFEADPDPMNLMPELVAMRGLFRIFIEKGEPDLAEAGRLLAEATKIVERQERIQNADAISRPNLIRLMREMGRAVEAYVPDLAVRQKIVDAWLAIRLA
jgi:hypothetical protein